ncbi:MAG: DUF4367 domain-containing protein [Clostridiales bacterium]|nr:DUF4367 domain-containing protein [Clostridiales bacterium]
MKNNSADSKSKRFFNTVIWLAAVFAVCCILARGNLFSLSDIFGSNLKNLRYQETEKIDRNGSGFDQYSTINEVEEHLETTFMLPGYLPDDYKLSYVLCSDIAESAVIKFSSEENNEAEIELIIRLITENKTIYMEKDDTDVYTIVCNNVEYNVFENSGETVIEWMNNGYSYMLSGTIEEKEVKKIVNNIR